MILQSFWLAILKINKWFNFQRSLGMVLDVDLSYLLLSFTEMLINQFVIFVNILGSEVLDHHFKNTTLL
jgi:hypothetical protein